MPEPGDRDYVASYAPLVRFLGEVVGQNSEVVLHDLSDVDASVIAIANGHVSNRGIGSPATDFALRVLEEDLHAGEEFALRYQGRVPGTTRVLSSSTFFIRRGTRLVGMLCINTDESLLRQLEALVSTISGTYLQPVTAAGGEEVPENLVASIQDVAREAMLEVATETSTPAGQFQAAQRIDVVRRLHERGFFHFKGAVQQISVDLQVSEPTAYRYLQVVKGEKGEQTPPSAGARRV